MAAPEGFGTLRDWAGRGLTMQQWHDRMGGPQAWLPALLVPTGGLASHIASPCGSGESRRVARLPGGHFAVADASRDGRSWLVPREDVVLWKLCDDALRALLVELFKLVPATSRSSHATCIGFVRTSPRGTVPVHLMVDDRESTHRAQLGDLVHGARGPMVVLTSHTLPLSSTLGDALTTRGAVLSSLDDTVEVRDDRPAASSVWDSIQSSLKKPATSPAKRRRRNVLHNHAKVREEVRAELKSRVNAVQAAWSHHRPTPEFPAFTQRSLAERTGLREWTLSRLLQDQSMADVREMLQAINSQDRMEKLAERGLKR